MSVANSKTTVLSVLILLAPVFVALSIAALAGGTLAADPASGVSCSVTGDQAKTLDLSKTQLKNAAIIHKVAVEIDLPKRASIIGIATALQESTLHNYGHLGDRNDHDSLGLFQQRPSQGWGTPEQITDPEYASKKFFSKLKTVEGWKTLPLTVAAQAVQGSAFPDAYAKHEPKATRIVATLTTGDTCQAVAGKKGWRAPVKAGIVSGYRTGQRPGHDGIDFGAARGTPIVAANAGTVKTVTCNASTNNCDVDGSPSVMGCGWYVEIQHADKTVTRYCHMLERPPLEVGQTVASGQTIGKVGSSGNSSGPHLHFETHSAYPATPDNAQSPIEFMGKRSVNLRSQ